MSKFSATEQDAINRALRPVLAIGLTPTDLFDDLWDAVEAGSVGITAAASDVDSLAKGGGHFTQDTATTSGLTLGYKAGRFHNGLALVSVAAGTILLSASTINYVEVDRSGAVSSNTSAFTSGRLPLFKVTTGGAAITTVEIQKPLMTLIGTGGVVGSMLSTAGRTKPMVVPLGDLSATTNFRLALPAHVGTIVRASFVPGTTVATSDTDYWTFGLVNKGAAGAGTTAIVDATAAANSTKLTGGAALTTNVKRALTLNGTPGVDAALDHASEDVVLFTATKTGSATTIAGASLRIDTTFTG